MIYIAVTNKIEKDNIQKAVENAKCKELLYEENFEDIKNTKKIKKSHIIICDNIEKAQELTQLKKAIIICKTKNVKESQENSYNSNLYTYTNDYELTALIKHFLQKERELKIIKNLLILIMLVIVTILIAISIPKGKMEKDKEVKNEETLEQIKEKERLERRKNFDFSKESIVFFGDSITDFYDLEKYYENMPVINSGTSGFQTKDLLPRIDEQVVAYNPTKVFILIGTNDIAFSKLTDEGIADNIKKIALTIRENRPNAKIYIESIFPISKEDYIVINPDMVGIRDNGRIKSVNSILKQICKDENITYINMYDILVNDTDNMTLEYTLDGLHLNDKGYEVLTDELLKYIYEEK